MGGAGPRVPRVRRARPRCRGGLPEKFRADHDARYDPEAALSADALGEWLAEVAAPLGKTKPVLLGAVPMFDATRLYAQFGLDPWHYRPVCVETMAWTALQLETPASPGRSPPPVATTRCRCRGPPTR